MDSLRPSKIASKMASISEPRNTRNTRKKDLFLRLSAYSEYSAVSSVRFGSGYAMLGFRPSEFGIRQARFNCLTDMTIDLGYKSHPVKPLRGFRHIIGDVYGRAFACYGR